MKINKKILFIFLLSLIAGIAFSYFIENVRPKFIEESKCKTDEI